MLNMPSGLIAITITDAMDLLHLHICMPHSIGQVVTDWIFAATYISLRVEDERFIFEICLPIRT